MGDPKIWGALMDGEPQRERNPKDWKTPKGGGPPITTCAPPPSPPPQLEKLKAEQSKQPATPLLGRKFLGDPPLTATTTAAPPIPITAAAAMTAATAPRPGGDETPEPPQPRVAYVRQELRPERLQPKVDRVRDGEGDGDRDPPAALPTAAVPPDLGVAKGDGGGDGGDAKTAVPERRRERRERRMERQESSEQEGARHGYGGHGGGLGWDWDWGG